MSVVSSMVITCGLTEHIDGGLPPLQAWCAAQANSIQFRPLDIDAAGGGKAMRIDVYAAAGNYYDHQALADVFPAFPWIFPEDAVLVAYPEDGPPVIVRGDGTKNVTDRA